jgi:5-methyltetrahydropteroyltriglutamate--homocysteine methyltransferase
MSSETGRRADMGSSVADNVTPRAVTVGSLLRPAYLQQARGERDAGRMRRSEFKRLEDQAVVEALALQESCGLDVVTDGEQRRLAYHLGPIEAFEGFVEATDQSRTEEWYSLDGETRDEPEWVVAVERLRRKRSIATEEFASARRLTTKPLKVTIPSPMGFLGAWHAEQSRAAYASPFELIADVARLLREDIEDLVDLGCEHIQIDAPEFTLLVDERRLADLRKAGLDAREVVAASVGHINALFEGIEGVLIGLHMCRGNWAGRFMAEGGYDALTEIVFSGATVVDEFLLEYDDQRSGSFEPLAAMPKDKLVVLGLVSTKHDSVEAEDELIARIDEAGRHHPLERLALSPQCGFASGLGGNPISEETQRRKLELVGSVARTVWG